MTTGIALAEVASATIVTVELELLEPDPAHRCTHYVVRVNGEAVGSAKECADAFLIYSWSLTIPGCCVNFGFRCRADLEAGVHILLPDDELEEV